MLCSYIKIKGVIYLKKALSMLILLLISSVLFAGPLYNFKDKIGDDNGPGKYTYPKNQVFIKNSFDLTELSIAEDGEDYIFGFKIGTKFKNDWKNVNGWDVQMFDVYMNFGTGKHKHTVAGRNLKITQGWDKVLVVSPEDNKKMLEKEIIPKNKDVYDDETASENLVSDIVMGYNYLIDNNQLFVRVSKKELPDFPKLVSIQVFLSGAEGYPSPQYTYIRNVNEANSEWRIGGGTDFDGDPNVMDILGDNSKMKNYKSTEDVSVYSWIDMIPVSTAKVTK